ncbi:uncharacterized protein LOC131639388 [Vicia villosa]|uniref:uncharacterized protein LOC131639388 n=1 Tax=Vicia villosa TaxID=3911 RepID=UPI00273BC1E7|nr:uncharacterized protein LOC131639388 [Vicia villosa]
MKEQLGRDYEFKLGMEFNSLVDFKDAIIEWSVLNGREITFVKNERDRVRVECKGKCGFLALCSKVGSSKTYQIKTWVGTHSCARVLNNRCAKSKWVAKYVVNKMQSSEKVKIADIIQDIRKTYSVGITPSRAWKAKEIAKGIVEGDAVRQYAMVWRYAAELKRACAGNAVKINVERPIPSIQPRFGAFYFCLDGCKRGFIQGCRPFIGVDGCHLKTDFGGQLLIAVGRDPNDQYFPLAFGVVETETKESWRWFLQMLMEDIGQDRKYVFISDQQKGLVSVFEAMFERIEHRLCLRHLYANFKKKFGGGTLIRDLMMGATKATYYHAWEEKMAELKKVDPKACEWLMKVPTKAWCKHAFNIYPKCDVLMNNISESFNATILCARDKPILTTCEWIRSYLMNRISSTVTKLEKLAHRIMPIPRKRLDKDVFMSGQWNPNWHACAALAYRQFKPEDYVDNWYSREKYGEAYSVAISPINGMDMWPPVEADDLLPPLYKKGPGRPKKLRFRELGEGGTRMRRVGVTYRCTKCDKIGHNSRKCKATSQNPAALKRKRKAPRKKPAVNNDVEVADPVDEEVADPVDDEVADPVEEVADPVDEEVADPVAEPTVNNDADQMEEEGPVVEKDEMPNEAQGPRIITTAAPKVVKKLKIKKKLILAGQKRSSSRLRVLKTLTQQGPGSSDNPLVIQEDEQGTLTQEHIEVGSDPKLGTCLRAMKSWSDISKK